MPTRTTRTTRTTIEHYDALRRCGAWILSEWRRASLNPPTDPFALWSNVKRFIDEYNECEYSVNRFTTIADKRCVYQLIIGALHFDGPAPYQSVYTDRELVNAIERIGHDPAYCAGFTVTHAMLEYAPQ